MPTAIPPCLSICRLSIGPTKANPKERFLDWAQQIGRHTQKQVETIFANKAYEEQAFRTLKGIQGLATAMAQPRLEAACRGANALGMVGYGRIKSFLKTNRDQLPLPAEVPPAVPLEHDNLRGQTYYH